MLAHENGCGYMAVYRAECLKTGEPTSPRVRLAMYFVCSKFTEEQEGCGDGSNGVFGRSAQPVCSIAQDGDTISLSFL